MEEKKMITKNFSYDEFKCPCCGYDEISIQLVYKLQCIREAYGKPIKISSGCRCKQHNKDVGGVENSEHVVGDAVDIVCSDGSDRYKLVTIALQYFKRIGISKNFIHLGQSSSLPNKVIWTY